MRKRKNIFAVLLIAVLACFAFTGCEETSSQRESEAQDSIESQDIEDIAAYTQNYFADTMVAASYEQFEAFEESGQTVVSVLFDNDWGTRWKQFVDRHGQVVDAQVDLTQKSDYNYTSRIILTGEDGEQMALTVTYNQATEPIKMAISDYSDDSKETLGSKMATAGVNTLTGLLVVFAILIFLCLIISCFKFIGKKEKKPENNDGTASSAPKAPAAPAAPAVSSEEVDLAKNQELVAVIAAAIAAYEDKPVEGYTVRSIRRLKSNKWR